MSHFHIPNLNSKCALFVVDVQPGFINRENHLVLDNIKKLFSNHTYDLYVEAIFYAPKGSLWEKQTNWTFPLEDTIKEINELFPTSKTIKTIKLSKSVFKGDLDVYKILTENNITEVHIVGFDTNDCVFATAQESFDLGFFTYVIEECTGSSNGNKLREAALLILRELGMTNHSRLIKSKFLI